jgi:hypothetical protein
MDLDRFRQLTCDVLIVKHGTLDDTNLERRCPLDHGAHDTTTIDDIHGFGTLGALPIETLHMILSQLDIQTLFTCRRLSRRAMHTINLLQEYRDLIHFVPNAIRGALSIESASYITCTMLHKAIFDGKCYSRESTRRQCDRPAQFICVLTGKRWCLRHLSLVKREDRNLPLFAHEVEDAFGLSAQQIADLPSFKNLPGHYSPNNQAREDRLPFIDGQSVYARAEEIHGSVKAVRAYRRLQLLEGLLSNRVLLPTKWEDWQATPDVLIQNFVRESSLPLSWNLGRLRTRRFMTVVLAPLFDYGERISRWGRYCTSCLDKDFSCWDIHTVDSLEEHLAEHETDPHKFPNQIPLEFCDTWLHEPQFNKDWPHVERRLVRKTSRSAHTAECWTHEEFIAYCNAQNAR